MKRLVNAYVVESPFTFEESKWEHQRKVSIGKGHHNKGHRGYTQAGYDNAPGLERFHQGSGQQT